MLLLAALHFSTLKQLTQLSPRASEVSCQVPVAQAGDTEMENSAQSSATPMVEVYGDEFWPLSGKPFFDIILTKAHVKPMYQMEIPAKLDPVPPNGTSVPMVLSFGDKSWDMTYNETKRLKLVDRPSWRSFIDDNRLKAGDGCVFKKGCDSTKVSFKVQILRGDIPAELLEKYSDQTEKPIVIYNDVSFPWMMYVPISDSIVRQRLNEFLIMQGGTCE